MFRFNLIIILIMVVGTLESKLSANNWGKEEGSLSWSVAKEKCELNGMRLPTKKELLSLYKSSERKKWSGNWYWSGDELDKERAWIVVLNVGDTAHVPKQYHNLVRCIN